MVCVPNDQRLPPQGGLPPTDAAGSAVEIACDESGFSGTNLLDAPTPIFTHASVDLRVDEAAQLIGAPRSGFSWSLSEFKSGQFLRGPQAGAALEWLATELSGQAHVHLVDKEYFLVTRIVDLFLVERSYAAGTRLTQHHRPAALTLYRAGRTSGRDWNAFLAAFVELARAKRRADFDPVRFPGRRRPDRPGRLNLHHCRRARFRANDSVPKFHPDSSWSRFDSAIAFTSTSYCASESRPWW